MIGLILSLALGLGLLFALLVMWRRNQAPAPEGSGQKLIDARNALLRLQTGLLPAGFVNQIFDRSDLDYVMATAPAEVQKHFLAERKRISISWVRGVRAEVLELRRFHLGQSRFQEHLSFRSEIKMGLRFGALLLRCRILELFLRVRGPYAASRALRATTGAAERVCAVSEGSLAFLAARGFDALREDRKRLRVVS
jgi:hypothetical protein